MCADVNNHLSRQGINGTHHQQHNRQRSADRVPVVNDGRGSNVVVNDEESLVGLEELMQPSQSNESFFEHRRRYTATFGEDVLAYPDCAPAALVTVPAHTSLLPPIPEHK